MQLSLENFTYHLPQERIAKRPAADRSSSKLLHYCDGTITHHRFNQITELLPKDSLLVFNDTKVIPARIVLHKDTGARIEIFLLEPLQPTPVHEEVMEAKASCSWKCMIGNAKKWKPGSALSHSTLKLTATRESEDVVTFEWSNADWTFSDLLMEIGKIPLPPYINREVDTADEERYQTVYSTNKGAVAAPTAGLHFTQKIIQDVERSGVKTDYVTLHVSAGTFQPIKAEDVKEHTMHNERIVVSRKNVQHLLSAETVVAVGTTSMRTLESLYWLGVRIANKKYDLKVTQYDPYSLAPIAVEEALQSVLSFMEKENIEHLSAHTEIFIYPRYTFRICHGLVTNYHLPASTLILLVAAFVGEDWRKIYDEALASGYSFLSYGDSSLLWRKKQE